MSLFRKRRTADPIESMLVEHRAEPTEDFSRSLLARIRSERPSRVSGIRPARRRLALSAGLTALALVGATAAAGGVGAASHGVASLTHVSNVLGLHTSSAATPANTAKAGDDTDSDDGPGAHQYAVKICHATGSKTNPYDELTLSPQGAAAHLLHHHGDFEDTGGGCPGAKQHP
jgi:hypothetical protein